tara:strand:- start:3290 stop:3400 length:111 start_codon:yes stop_codon:yes gene_type:complete
MGKECADISTLATLSLKVSNFERKFAQINLSQLYFT